MNRSDHAGNDPSKNNGRNLSENTSHLKSQGNYCQTKRQISGDRSNNSFQSSILPENSAENNSEDSIWKSAENINIPNEQTIYVNQPEEDKTSDTTINKKKYKVSPSASTSTFSHSEGLSQEGSWDGHLDVPGNQSDERTLSPTPSHNLDSRKNHLSVHHSSSTPSPRLRSQSPNPHISGESSDEKGEKYDHFNLSVFKEGTFERSVSFQEGILDQQHLNEKHEILKSAESSRSLDQTKSLDSSSTSNQTIPTSGKERKDREGKTSDKKSRKAWYNVLNPTYKSRSEDLKRLFKDLPSDERLIVDYSCALQKDILVHGRLYVTPNYFCFYSKIFGWETFLSIKCKDIVAITKEKTALVIPNALQINTDTDKNFFTSFAARDKTYLMLFRIWQNALLGQQVSATELWQWVHSSYGEELGLTSDDDDYVAPSTEDDTKSPPFIPIVEQNEEKKSIDSTEDASQAESNQEDKSEPVTRTSIRKSPARSSPVQQTPYPAPPQTLHLHSDFSDSNDSEPSSTKITGSLNETVICPDITSHHQGREVINTVLSLPIDEVFTHLFTNSKFMLDLHKARKTYDVVASDWQSNPETNQKIRQVTYTLTLPTNSFGPKVSHVTETQVISAFSKPSEIYTVDAEACNGGIPYADCFSVSNHWCLTRESAAETRLNVWTEVKYKKNVWGFMKSVIDKNAFSGMKSLINDINNSLLLEVDKTSSKVPRRRRRRVGSKSMDLVDPMPIAADKIKDVHKAAQVPSRKIISVLPSICAKVVPVVEAKSTVRSAALLFLCVLLGVNAFLYYRLYTLEVKMINRSPVTFDPAIFKRSEDVPVQEWVKILHEQEVLHSSEVDRWKKAVSEAADYLKKAEESLRNLHASIPAQQATKVQSLLRHLHLLQHMQEHRPSKPPDGAIPTEHEERDEL